MKEFLHGNVERGVLGPECRGDFETLPEQDSVMTLVHFHGILKTDDVKDVLCLICVLLTESRK